MEALWLILFIIAALSTVIGLIVANYTSKTTLVGVSVVIFLLDLIVLLYWIVR